MICTCTAMLFGWPRIATTARIIPVAIRPTQIKQYASALTEDLQIAENNSRPKSSSCFIFLCKYTCLQLPKHLRCKSDWLQDFEAWAGRSPALLRVLDAHTRQPLPNALRPQPSGSHGVLYSKLQIPEHPSQLPAVVRTAGQLVFNCHIHAIMYA